MTQELVPTPSTLEPQILDDLYERLGVAPSASYVQIKAAYRALASFYHPDNLSTGNRQMFDSIQEAYDTLSDPEKRKLYDEVGTIEKGRLDDPVEIEAREHCGVIINNIIAQEANPDAVDILAKMTRVFSEQEKGLRKREHELADRERRTRIMRKRLKRPKKKAKKNRSAFLLLMLDSHIKQIAEAHVKLEHDKKVVARVKEIFAEYEYEVEVQPVGGFETTFEMLRSGMRSPNEPRFFHMGSSFDPKRD